MTTSTPIYDSLQRGVARKNDRITSVIAGETVAPKSTAREDVLKILAVHGPLHDHGIEILHDEYVGRGLMAYKSGQRLRSARSELEDMGLVQEHKQDGAVVCVRMRSGFPSTVWEVAP